MKRLSLFLLMLFSLVGILCAQSGAAGRPYQRTRSLSSQADAYDLPYLTVKRPFPQQASDQTQLIVFSPDSMEVEIRLKEWLVGHKAALTHTYRIGPGRQELPIPLQGLPEGAYVIEVLRRGNMVAIKHLEVYR